MTHCHDVQAFHDGELPAPAADAFRDHLGGCASCQERLLELMQLGALSAELAREPQPHWAEDWAEIWRGEPPGVHPDYERGREAGRALLFDEAVADACRLD